MIYLVIKKYRKKLQQFKNTKINDYFCIKFWAEYEIKKKVYY